MKLLWKHSANTFSNFLSTMDIFLLPKKKKKKEQEKTFNH